MLDYTVDWTDWLGSDTIASVVWTTRGTLAVDHQEHTPKTATVWLEGGEVRQKYAVTCRITTTAGRVDDRTFTVNVVQK